MQLFTDLPEDYVSGAVDRLNGDKKSAFKLALEQNKLVGAVGLLIAGADPNEALRVAIEVRGQLTSKF